MKPGNGNIELVNEITFSSLALQCLSSTGSGQEVSTI